MSTGSPSKGVVIAQAEERALTPQEEQVKWLQDAANSVKRNAFYMKRALVSTRVAAACACAPCCALSVTVPRHPVAM